MSNQRRLTQNFRLDQVNNENKTRESGKLINGPGAVLFSYIQEPSTAVNNSAIEGSQKRLKFEVIRPV